MVNLNRYNMQLLDPQGGGSLAALRGQAYDGQLLRSGDTIEVTVYDTGENGFFSSTDSKTLNLGKLTIDNNGYISMPFVGRQKASGQTPEGLQEGIVAALKGKAVNPQAVVTIIDRPGNAVSVTGEVKTPGRFQLSGKRERVLDVLAQAGGSNAAPNETTVAIVRGPTQLSTTLAKIMSDPNENIYVVPNDQIVVQRETPTFTALGALRTTGEHEFQPGRLTLGQAIGRAGGLLDERADPKNVFIFRSETPAVAAAFGVISGEAAKEGRLQPMIYKIDMSNPASFFIMQAFQMRAGDILFVSNSKMVEWTKFLTVLQPRAPTIVIPSAPGMGRSGY